MTAKETIARVEKEREELRGYFGKEMEARCKAQSEARQAKRDLELAHAVGIRMTAERDVARKENAQLRRDVETEHEHVRLLTAENDRLSGSLDSALDQLIERGHEIARLRGVVAARHAGTKFARFVGRIAQIVGLS